MAIAALSNPAACSWNWISKSAWYPAN